MSDEKKQPGPAWWRRLGDVPLTVYEVEAGRDARPEISDANDADDADDDSGAGPTAATFDLSSILPQAVTLELDEDGEQRLAHVVRGVVKEELAPFHEQSDDEDA